ESRLTATAWLTRVEPRSSTSRRTNVRVTNSTSPASVSACHVKSGEYFAPIGHTGAHVSLRQHAGRPRYGCDALAEGWLHRGTSAFSPQWRSCSRLYVSGSGGSGYGFERGSSSSGPCTPATPMRYSASW